MCWVDGEYYIKMFDAAICEANLPSGTVVSNALQAERMHKFYGDTFPIS